MADQPTELIDETAPTLNPPDAAEPPPPQLPFLPPPEIVSVRDDDLIDERGLNNKVARYYPATHQLFINLTYGSIVRLTERLKAEFAELPDAEQLLRLAQETAEWAVTRKVARSVVFSLTKAGSNWSTEEIARAQSCESLSLLADDTILLLPVARRRMRAALGLEDAGLDERPQSATDLQVQQLAGELTEAKQAARRGLATQCHHAGPATSPGERYRDAAGQPCRGHRVGPASRGSRSVGRVVLPQPG